jgi:hypothetical protein
VQNDGEGSPELLECDAPSHRLLILGGAASKIVGYFGLIGLKQLRRFHKRELGDFVPDEKRRVCPFKKNSKKSEKKACQLSGSSINEEKLADKSADFPFKNIFKKVKKKLASLSNIQ